MTGFICALDAEIEGIVNKMENRKEETIAKLTFFSGTINGTDVVATECGVGKVNSAMSTQIMIDRYSPDTIINSGIAGSLSKDIRICDIVISSDCVQHDYDTTELGDPLGMIYFNDEKIISIPADEKTVSMLKEACETLEDTNIFTGRIASGDSFIGNRSKRQKIADTFGALACEMEGAAAAQVCYRNGVPFAILRCISDDFSMKEKMDYHRFRNIAAEKSVKVIIEYLNIYRKSATV